MHRNRDIVKPSFLDKFINRNNSEVENDKMLKIMHIILHILF